MNYAVTLDTRGRLLKVAPAISGQYNNQITSQTDMTGTYVVPESALEGIDLGKTHYGPTDVHYIFNVASQTFEMSAAIKQQALQNIAQRANELQRRLQGFEIDFGDGLTRAYTCSLDLELAVGRAVAWDSASVSLPCQELQDGVYVKGNFEHPREQYTQVYQKLHTLLG